MDAEPGPVNDQLLLRYIEELAVAGIRMDTPSIYRLVRKIMGVYRHASRDPDRLKKLLPRE